ncbi:flagellar basal body protein [Cellvibrio sp. ARAG 10.3]
MSSETANSPAQTAVDIMASNIANKREPIIHFSMKH